MERQREFLAAFDESRLTRAEFVRREGLKSLCNWVQREGKANERVKGSAAVHFAEVALPRGVLGGLGVRLPDGTILRGERVAEPAALARALQG